MNLERTIFVQIPSYRDPQLLPTLKDMIENAKSPFLLRIVICWQHGAEQDIQSFEANGFELTHTASEEGATVHFLRIHGANIELIDIDYIHSKGCGWARNLAQRRYRGEHYNLQIDSHHRFSAEWDFKMKSLLELLRVRSSRPLLTGYPPSFDPDTYPSGRQEYTAAIIFDSFSPTGVVRFRSVRLPAPVHGEIAFKAKFVAGGFIFSDGAFTQEVMSDPDHFFCTEEIATSIRAFTKGYDFYHPYAPLLWHQYDNHARKVWDDQPEPPAANSATSMTLEDRSSAALRKTLALVGLPTGSEMEDFGVYGLGSQRTLRQYERHTGINFRLQAVHKQSLTVQEPVLLSETFEENEWKRSLVYFRSMRVHISCTTRCPSFPASVLVSSYSSDGARQSTRELSKSELKFLSREGQVQYVDTLRVPLDQLPVRYSVHVRSGDALTDHQLSIFVEEVLV
ncbi:GlcNAc-transferase family protein [Stenotrophomonas geniculata]|uniref:GlcNAc-transferase family protein n=1 Tax=Stenotrophomonas geniculata TaxID=86188 RepID=UPI002E797832|nr:GlcNAc-transferase family protein [Stenotrophomonas geniculata]